MKQNNLMLRANNRIHTWIRTLLEPYRWKFSWGVRSFLEKHRLLERKAYIIQSSCTFTLMSVEYMSKEQASEAVNSLLIDKFWFTLLFFLKYNYRPDIRSIQIKRLPVVSDAIRFCIYTTYVYNENPLSMDSMLILINTLKEIGITTVRKEFFYEKQSDHL